MNWISAAFIGVIFSAAYIILFTYYSNKIHPEIDTITLIFNLYIVSAIIGLVYLLIKKKEITLFTKPDIGIVLIGGLFILSTFFCFYSLRYSPNPSYANSIVNLNAIVVLLVTIILFKQKLNKMAMLGVLLTTIGVILIINYGKTDKDIDYSKIGFN